MQRNENPNFFVLDQLFIKRSTNYSNGEFVLHMKKKIKGREKNN